MAISAAIIDGFKQSRMAPNVTSLSEVIEGQWRNTLGAVLTEEVLESSVQDSRLRPGLTLS